MQTRNQMTSKAMAIVVLLAVVVAVFELFGLRTALKYTLIAHRTKWRYKHKAPVLLVT